jgi:hypothetical protein
MSQWGRNDQAVTANSTTTKETSNGAPTGTYALVNGGATSNIATIAVAKTPNGHFGNTSDGSRAAIDVTMYGNTTINAFRQGQAVGVFGVDAAEMSVTTGSSNGLYRVTSGGTGYGANAVVTLTFSNSTSTYTNALASNSTVGTSGTGAGRVTAVTGNATVTGIIGQVSLAIAAPGLIIFNGNSAVDATNDTITITSANTRFQVGDGVTYAGNTLSTPAGLTDSTKYYVSFANSTVLALAATPGGSNVNIAKAAGDNTTAGGATLQGETATAVLIPSGAKRHAAHAGWVLRTEGTGGRAGRVQYETIVAMGSLGAQTAAYGTPALVADGSDDNVVHDS